MTAYSVPSPTKSSAGGQYLGYSLQQVRLCFHLLAAADGDLVSLEIVDDVAIHRADGSVLLEQSKSALSGNPASEKAEDLWKTFANWAEGCKEANLSIDSTDFRYYVSPSKSAAAILSKMVKATSDAEASILLKKLKKLVTEGGAELAWVKQLQRFLEAGDDVCSKIIQRCSFETEADPLAGVRDRLNLLPEDVRGDYVAAIIGLARDRIDMLIRMGEPRVIEAKMFRTLVWAFVRRHNFSNVLHPTGTEPDPAEISAVADMAPLFVRQLAAIEAKPIMMISAISDYLRTTADKVQWAARGTVLEDSFAELNSHLTRRHGLICDDLDDTNPPLDPTRRGRQVYRRCAQENVPLDGQSLPSYFVAGAFNCLAQDRHLGWHPDYLNLFPAE